MCLQSACIFKVENHKKIFEMLCYVISKKKEKKKIEGKIEETTINATMQLKI